LSIIRVPIGERFPIHQRVSFNSKSCRKGRQLSLELVAMAGRPPEPTLRYLTRQQPDTEKNKKMPNAQRKFFANAFGTFGFAPTHKANASQNQKSQANQSPPTTPNYF